MIFQALRFANLITKDKGQRVLSSRPFKYQKGTNNNIYPYKFYTIFILEWNDRKLLIRKKKIKLNKKDFK